MRIAGMQKLSLLDYPGHTAATIFTEGCNFRCPFCHNATLISTEESSPLGTNEVISFLLKRRGLLDGVCISGGEPLLHNDLAYFLRQIKDLGFLLKLDTNGSFPDRLQDLLNEGLLDYIAMDIKAAPEKYSQACGVTINFGDIQKSVNILMKGRTDYEFRTTMVQELQQPKDFLEIAHWLNGAKKYYLQAFKDTGNLLQSGLHSYSKDEAEQIKTQLASHFEFVELRGY